MKKSEENLQIAVCKYIRHQFPQVIFTSESSGLRLTMGQAVKAKKCRSEGKLPDLIILEPRGHASGLILELKKQGEVVYNRDGSYRAGHVAEQGKTLERLRKKGYIAQFVIGFDNAKFIIDTYLRS